MPTGYERSYWWFNNRRPARVATRGENVGKLHEALAYGVPFDTSTLKFYGRKFDRTWVRTRVLAARTDALQGKDKDHFVLHILTGRLMYAVFCNNVPIGWLYNSEPADAYGNRELSGTTHTYLVKGDYGPDARRLMRHLEYLGNPALHGERRFLR